jgi:hypothetical protein
MRISLEMNGLQGEKRETGRHPDKIFDAPQQGC